MKKLTFNRVAIVLIAAYSVVWLERLRFDYSNTSEIVLENKKQDIEREKTINRLNLKIEKNEIERIKKQNFVDAATNDQLDSMESEYQSQI